MKVESNKNEAMLDKDEEISAELKIVLENKLPQLYLPDTVVHELTKELNLFTANNTDKTYSGIKEISKQMDMIMNYITMRQSVMHDKNVNINLNQLSKKMHQALENIHTILRGEVIKNDDEDTSIKVHRTDDNMVY